MTALRPREIWRTRKPTVIYVALWSPILLVTLAHEVGWIA